MSGCSRILTIVLAGGEGTRLAPLTQHRAKPAVPFGGQYRIIDFTLSNCLHSGLRQILVLTQYKSDSLHRHLRDAWSIFNPQLNEYITAIPPQLRTGDSWYRGTADAISQNLHILERSNCDYVLVLSGDHIYRMDYSQLLEVHQTTAADVTVACMKVPLTEARSFGILSVDSQNRIGRFSEKPDRPAALPDAPDMALASMGIYLFSKSVLCEILRCDEKDDTSSHDFGKDLLPQLIHSHNVFAYRFGEAQHCKSLERYWRDVGTIDAYYQANMDLLKERAPLDLYCGCWPIRKNETQAPPVCIDRDGLGLPGAATDSLLSIGVHISGGTVQHSILSPNVRVDSGAIVEDSILLDGVRVGEGAWLRKCIIDKDVRVPVGETVGINERLDAQRFTVSDSGVVVVPSDFRFASPPRAMIRTGPSTRPARVTAK